MLNVEQHAAVETMDGPLLVLAGAGSGKTRVVTFRIIHLVKNGIPPYKILGLTFTNKAAGEMMARIKAMTDCQILICTFHSLGARLLRERIDYLGYRRDFSIYDEQDSEKLLKTCLDEIGTGHKIDSKKIQRSISEAKNAVTSPENAGQYASSDIPEELFSRIYAHYQAKLKEYNAVDFDDLLYLPSLLFNRHPEILEYYQDRWSHLLIDEYQDTNHAQYSLVQALAAKHHNLCVVGDPDQSIYSWRGANIKNILNFEKDYPDAKVIHLQQNYRSRTNILTAANALISHNYHRFEKELWSELGPGEKIKCFAAYNEKEEAGFVAEKINDHHINDKVPLNQIVVFYRTNAQSRALEDVFLLHHIPYVIVGGISFYQRKEIKDILAFLRMVQSGSDYVSFVRTINLPKRGIGEATIEKIRQGASQENRSIFSFCQSLVAGHSETLRLSSKQKTALQDYVRIMQELAKVKDSGSLTDLVKAAIDGTHYLNVLKEDPESFEDRAANLNSLIAKALEWESSVENPSLESFLEELSLKTTLDDADVQKERVNLMTIHNGKGLEFFLTFIVGMEEDLFPHANSRDDELAQEEERRLFYVGITRAKELLYLCLARQRFLWGTQRFQRPSRFLEELPSSVVEVINRSREYPSVKKSVEKVVKEVDPFIAEEALIFEQGDAVFHKEFGIGTVRTIYHGSAGLMYKVFFSKSNSEKTLVAQYAPLQKI